MHASSTKRQAGFSAIEVLFVVAIVMILALIGVYIFGHGHKNAKTTGSTTQKSVTTTATGSTVTKNQTPGTDEFCSKQEGACFDYPSTWTLTTDSSTSMTDEKVNLKSPNGTTLTWDSNVMLSGEKCDTSTTASAYINQVQDTKVTNVYAVSYGYGAASDATAIGLVNGMNGLAPDIGNTSLCAYTPTFKSEDGTRDMSFAVSTSHFKAADLQADVTILTSLHYKQ